MRYANENGRVEIDFDTPEDARQFFDTARKLVPALGGVINRVELNTVICAVSKDSELEQQLLFAFQITFKALQTSVAMLEELQKQPRNRLESIVNFHDNKYQEPHG